jgi:hypothetical protein
MLLPKKIPDDDNDNDDISDDDDTISDDDYVSEYFCNIVSLFSS